MFCVTGEAGSLCFATTPLLLFVTLHYCTCSCSWTYSPLVFLEKKVPRTRVVLKMAIQFRKKGVHDFMCTTSLMCKKQYINITEELNSKQRNQNSDIYFTENIPKTSKNASHVLECEFFWKASLWYSTKRYIQLQR